MALDAAGYEICQADESLFNADHYNGQHWAPVGEPIRKISQFTGLPRIVVCGVISPIRGKIYMHYGVRSFNAQDML